MRTQEINKMLNEAEVIFVNHSGGKDSQAMLAYIRELGYLEKCVIVHADLGEMEWEPMEPFIQKNSFGRPVYVVHPPMNFFELCRRMKSDKNPNGRLPGGVARFCTNELKTQPIKAWIREYCKERGIKKVVNAMGIRAEESKARAKKEPLKVSEVSLQKEGLEVMEWYPIFEMKLKEVWEVIKAAGQEPHPIYAKGFSRLSCVFCVYGRVGEHKKAAKMRPELYEKMVALEKELGRTIRLKQVKGVKMPKYLNEYCA